MSEHIIVMTTVANEIEGVKLARELVERRMAACVNVTGPIRSVFRWHDEVQDAEERHLLIKTVSENLDRVKATINELHAYELPEIIVLPIESGDETYLNWITAQSSPPPPEE